MASDRETRRVVVDCQDCEFYMAVSTDGDRLPETVLREHADKTGHALSLSGPDAR